MQVNWGWIPDEPSAKDYRFADLQPRLQLASPNDVFTHRIPLQRPPRRQVGGSCVANAWARKLEILTDLTGASCPDLSAQYLYWTARQRDSSTQTDDGTTLRSAADAVRCFGVPPDSDWPSDVDSVNTKPSLAAMQDAYPHRIESSYRIDDGDLSSIEVAVRCDQPVAFGVYVPRSFMTYDGDPKCVFDLPVQSVGAHAMLVVGVEWTAGERIWTWLNSWGSWGIGGAGLVRVTDRYMRTARDLWVGVIAP